MTLADALAAAHREQPLHYASRDGDPAIRRKLNSKHQKARASRNRKLTAAELAERIRTLVQRQPRTLSKVQSALRLDGKTTAAAITEGEKSGRLKTVPTARGRRIEPLGDPSPHTRPPEAVDLPHRLARELARHFAAYRAPEGGVAVKGLYYPGGQLVPDLTQFAAEPREAEEVAMRPTGSYRGSSQFTPQPIRTAEGQVVRPAGPSYRGSQQLQLLPPRPNGLRLLQPDTPKPPPRPIPSARPRADSPPLSKSLTRPAAGRQPPTAKPKSKPPAKAKPKDDGVPIRDRTRESKRTVIDKLRRLIAKHLTPTRYARGDGEHTHAAFHANFRNGDRLDRLAPLVYADWLEENEMPAYASVIREHQQRASSQPHHYATNYHYDAANDEQVGKIAARGWPLSDGRHAVSVGYTDPETSHRTYHTSFGSPEEAHRLATQLEAEGVADADAVRTHLERRHPQIFSPPQHSVPVTPRRPIRRD